nr:MAG TPA: KilAC domain protein [Caudoviricetes sp.]
MEKITGKETMTSLEIAEVTGKRHSDVLEAIRNMESAWARIAQRKFPLGSYKDANNQSRPCYILNKTECLYVATKFNDEARAKLVLRWEELESQVRKSEIIMPNFSNPAEAARAWADQYEQRLKLEVKAREDAPKVEFFESVAESKDAVEMKAVSSTLNYVAVGRNKLFAILREQKVLQSNNIPYQKYIDAGYFRTIETKKNCGTEVRIFIKTLVYQKGLDYIRKLLNKLGYKPKESKEQTLLEFKD